MAKPLQMDAPAGPAVTDQPVAVPPPRPEAAESASGRSPRRSWLPRRRRAHNHASDLTPAVEVHQVSLDIAAGDPILAFLQGATGPVAIDTLPQDAPSVRQMREANVELVVPLVASGELVGLMALGPRLSERGYSHDDRKLLDSLARYAAPALRLGQLVRQQEAEARGRERIEQELKVAQIIQQQFLPSSLPDLAGWHLSAFYRPARSIGGDFYDVMQLPDGRIMVVTGDVTDKGVPAALVMASTHSLLREAGPRLVSPSAVLARVNELLCDDIPDHMFVTCLVLVADLATGEVVFANAGHNLPLVRGDSGVRELRATGMPLGLMLESEYDEIHDTIETGDVLLLYSDGITEQHDDSGEMFGTDRTRDLVGAASSGAELLDACVGALARFSGTREQEDDVTMLTLERGAASRSVTGIQDSQIATFTVASEPGNERDVIARIAPLISAAGLSQDQVDALKTAVGEATMNAIEHGNHNRAELPVEIELYQVGDSIVVEISDQGGRRDDATSDVPDLDLKLAGLQTPRGWGLYLIENLVDSFDEHTKAGRHTVRLGMNIGTNQQSGGDS